jgi:hypothetical protein
MRSLRTLKRHFGIAAPHMWVQAHVPWYWRWPLLLLLLGVGLALAGTLYETGARFAGFERVEAESERVRLAREAGQLRADNAELRAALAQSERQLSMERATQVDLAKSVNALQEESARLKEDLMFFRKVKPTAGNSAEVSINNASVVRGGEGEYRYQFLVLRGGQRERDFQGRVELVVNLLNDGRKSILTVPGGIGGNQPLRLNFKYYQRVEGKFRVPAKAIVNAVQVKIFDNEAAQPRFTQAVTLS